MRLDWLTHIREEYPPIRGEIVVRKVRRDFNTRSNRIRLIFLIGMATGVGGSVLVYLQFLANP